MTTGVPRPAPRQLPGDAFNEAPEDESPADMSLAYPRDRPAPNPDNAAAVLEHLQTAE